MNATRVEKFIASLLITAFVIPFCFLSPTKVSAQSAISSAGIGCLANLGSNLIISALNSLVTVPVSDSQQLNDTFHQACVKPFERAVTQQLLQKVTQETTRWVNTGFEGNPFYPRDLQSYNKSLANEQVRDFVSELKLNSTDPDSNPFDRIIAKSIVTQYSGTYEDKSRYTMNEVVGSDNAKNFNNDFSAGGWESWITMTQLPQNNIVGKSIQDSNELSSRIGSKQATSSQELQQNNGFISMKKCVEKKPSGVGMPTDPDDQTAFALLGYDQSSESNDCLRYETVTPGSIIQGQLDRSIGTGQKQLEAGNDLNKGITAVFTSLFTELYNGGVQSVGGGGTPSGSGSNVAVYGGYGNNTIQNNINPTNGGGSTGLGSGSTHWFETNPDFDISDPAQLQKVIDDQTKYIAVLNSEISAITNGFIPNINQADFCVPGPHVGWADQATIAINKKNQEIANHDEEGWDDSEKEQYHSQKLAEWIGLFVSPSDINIRGKDRVSLLLNRALEGGDDITSSYFINGYVQKIYNRYHVGGTSLPPSATSIFNMYSYLATYQDMIRTTPDGGGKRGAILEKIAVAEGNKASLINIQTTLSKAKADLTSGAITQAAYDVILQTKKNTFENIAPTLAEFNVINTVQAEIDLINLKTDTLSGPTGLIHQCEDEVNTGLYRTERMPYPVNLSRPAGATNYQTIFSYLVGYVYGSPVPVIIPETPPIPNEDYQIHVSDVVNPTINGVPGNSPTIFILERTIGIY